MNKKEISLLLGLVFTIAFSVCSQHIKAAEDVKADTLRLHIIANSDSAQDQQIKLAVRDKLLQAENLLPANAMDFEQAVQIMADNLTRTEEAINSFLEQNDVDYSARCSIERFYFDTTEYDDFALPQGEYTALTVRLGQAQGKNWWCVVYPALCSQSCGQIVLEDSDSFIKTDRITPRFKVVEIYEDIKVRFAQRAEEYKNLG